MDKNHTNNMWPNRDVLIICEDTNYYGMVREILRPLKWIVQMPASDAQAARDRLLSKTFGAIIIIESRKIPATEVLRTIFQQDRGRLTPVLVLTNFSEPLDLQLFQKIYSVAVSIKPLIPIKFMSAFREMLSLWEQPAMHALRQLAALGPDDDKEILKFSILEKLATDANASSCAIQAMMVIMMNQNLYREAEKKLLEYFRTSPGNPSILAQCAWFYLDSRAPHYALKFLHKLKHIAPESVVLNIDIACAHIACGHLDKALTALQEWNNKFPGNINIESYIARLAIAEGRDQTSEPLGVPSNTVKRANEVWEQFDTKLSIKPNKPDTGIKAS